MSVVTINKNDGLFIYADYSLSKIAKRLRSDLVIDQFQAIRRYSNSAVEAYMVSKEWWDNKVADYAAAMVSMPEVNFEKVADDLMAVNMSTYIHILKAEAVVPGMQQRVNNEGPSLSYAKGYIVIDTKKYNTDILEVQTSSAVESGDNELGRLIPAATFDELLLGP